MSIAGIAVSTLSELYERAEGRHKYPEGLEGNLLRFFLSFKKAFDNKNERTLSHLISNRYYSSSFVNKNKKDLVNYFGRVFDQLPFFIYPNLEIEICTEPDIVEGNLIYLVIMAFINLEIFAIPVDISRFPLGTDGRIGILLEKDPASGVFRIVNMEALD
ncbi:hypothetical protein [Thermostichus vulcanus]|uniref:Uncharacterized protein n=1 Tax=Thermostichus vulcanus str. 'Rupite' TaxID=2813851 RepID=A0ABT0CCK4_THEVL|nr:hypothetical protein [Thermostichus vulcanus]MCJ2543517.1 hypothetical protein [Thermostichus vulcanus str. 'Rupite']